MLPFLAALAVQSSLTIAKDGRSSWTIVVDAKAPNRHGAEEIQNILLQSTGAKLAIVDKPTKARSIRILSDPKLLEEEYVIRTTPKGIEIRGGGKRGPMYGCYGFLRDIVGCRWFTSTISKIPKISNLKVGKLEIHERAAFEYREPYFTEAFQRDWDLRNQVNGSAMPLDESVGGKIQYGRFVHTFAELVPPEKYYKDHPEYFSFAKGKRQDGYAQLCLTNPDVLKISIEKVRQWIKENPNATIFSVSQNDTYLNCECDNCKKVDQEEGSPSGSLLRFVNKVADAIAQESPNVLIQTLAYQWSERPPLHERPHKNVRICLAPIGACFTHALDQCDRNKAPMANLQAWSNITKQLYIWHYCTDFANYLQPLPDIDEIVGDIRLFHKIGVVGVFYEGAYGAGGGGDMAELKSYLIARLLWEPSQPVKPLIFEFLNGVYGEAAPEIQQWLDLLQRPFAERTMHATIYDPPSAPYFTPEMLAKAELLFDEAERKTPLNPTAAEAVQKARMSLDYLEFMRRPESDPAKKAYGVRLAAKIRRFKVGETSEGGSSDAFLKRYGL